MEIVISPAEIINEASPLPTEYYSSTIFTEEIAEVHVALQSLSPQQLSTLMSVSPKSAELNQQRNQVSTMPLTPQNTCLAPFVYDGDIYEGLDAYSLVEARLNKLQESLRILSGLYEVLKPLDLIAPYRLEMDIKLSISKVTSLYVFWGERITQAFNDESEEGKLFINLASKEYFKTIDVARLRISVITPVFKDYRGDMLKIMSLCARKTRERMMRYLAENDIRSAEDFEGFNTNRYMFSEKFSKENTIIFIG